VARACMTVLEAIYRNEGVNADGLRDQEREYLKAYAAVQDLATPGSMHLLNGARRALRLFYLFHDVHELGQPDGPNALVVSPCTQECCGLWAHHDRLVWSGKVVGPQPGPIEPWEA